MKVSILPISSVVKHLPGRYLTQSSARTSFALTLILIVWGSVAMAQSIFTANNLSGNWTTIAWVKSGAATAATYPGQIAGENHQAVISGTSAVTLNTNISNTSITSIAHNSTGTLALGANTLTTNVICSLVGTGTATISTGTLSIGGGIALTTLTATGAASIQVGGIWNTNFTPSTSTVTFNGVTQSILRANANFRNLIVASGSTTSTAQNINIEGDLTVNGNFSQTANRTTFNGTTAQAIGGTGALSFFNVSINTNARTVSVNSNITIAGTATGTNNNGSDAAFGIGTGSTLSLGSAIVTLTGTGLATMAGTGTLTAGTSTFVFSGVTVIATAGYTFRNIQINSGNSLTTALTITISGDLVNNNGTFSQTAAATIFSGTSQSISGTGSPTNTFFGLTINASSSISTALSVTTNGVYTNSGVWNSSAGTFILNGAATNIAGTNIFNHFTIGGSSIKTLLSSPTINGNLTINAGATLQFPAGGTGYTLTVAGNSTFTGTMNTAAPGTATTHSFINSGTLSVLTGGNLTLQNGTNVVNTTTNGSSILAGGTLIFNNLTTSNAAGVSINNNFSVRGNLNNSLGTFTASAGRATFDGASAQTIGGAGGDLNFFNLTVNTNARTVSLGANFIITGTAVGTNSNGSDAAFGIGLGATVSPLTSIVTFQNTGSYTQGGTVTVGTSLYIFDGTTSLSSASSFNNIQINSGRTLNSTQSINLAGNLANNGGTFSQTAGTTTFSGTSQSISGTGSPTTTFNAVTINPSASISNAITVTVNGAYSNSGIWNSSAGTFTLNGVATNIGGTNTFNHFTIGGSSTKTLLSSPTVNGNLTINSGVTLQFPAGGTGYTLSVAGSTTVTGTMNTAAPGTTTTHSFVNTGSLTVLTGGNLTLVNGTNLVNTTMNGSSILAGGILVFNNLTTSNAGGVSINNNFSVRGSLNNSTATFTSSSGRASFDGTAAQTIGGAGGNLSFFNLTVNTNVRTVSLGANITISGTATGTTANGSDAAFGIGTGATFSSGIYTITFQNTGSYTQGGTHTAGTSLFVFDGTTSISSASAFANIQINSGQALNSSQSINIAGNLTNNGGTYSQTAGTTTFSGSSQSISGTGSPVFTFNGVTIAASSTVSTALDLTFNGTFANSGTFTASAGTVTYNGGSQNIGCNSTFYNLVVGTNTKTINCNLNITNNLTVNLGATLQFDASGTGRTVNIGGLTSIAGTFNAATPGTASTHAVTIGGNLSVSGTSNFVNGTNRANLTFAGSTIDGAGSFTFNSITLTGSTVSTSSSWTILGDFTNNATSFAASAGRITFNRTSAQSISGSSLSTQFFNLSIGNTAGTVVSSSLSFTIAGTANGNAFNTAAFGIGSTSSSFTAPSSITFTGSGASFETSQNFIPGSGTVIFAGSTTLTNITNFNNIQVNAGNSVTTALKVRIASDLVVNSGTYTQSADSTIFNGTNQNIGGTGSPAITCNHIAFSNSGTKTLTANVVSNNSINIRTGATFACGSFTAKLSGDFTRNGTFTPGTGTILFTGAIAQPVIVNATTFNNITISKSTGRVLAQGVVLVNGTTTISATSTLDLANITSNNLGTVVGSGRLAITANGGANTDFPSGNFSNFLGNSLSTVEYYGTNGYNIFDAPILDYTNVSILGAGTKTLTNPMRAVGTVLVDDNAVLSLGITTLELKVKNLVNNSSILGGSSGVLLFSCDTLNQVLQGNGSYNLFDLVLTKGGKNLSMQSPIRIIGNIIFNEDGLLLQNANDITLSSTSQVITNTIFGRYCMIQQDGTPGPGSLIKEGTTPGQFVNSGLPVAVPFTFPIGSDTIYAPAQITTLAATITGTATVIVKTVPLVTSFTNILKRYWKINTTGISSITDARLEFTFRGVEVSGSPNYVNRTLDAVVNAVTGSYFTGITGTQKFGVNTAGNTFLEELWGLSRTTSLPRTYYSYITGNWATPTSWTTDPTGTTLINSPAVGGPGSNDNVVILTGRTITLSASNKTLTSVSIRSGGNLDIGTTTGQSFGSVSGSGLLKLATLTLPFGTYTDFVAPGGGTIEYTNVAGVIPFAQTTYNNLILSGTGTKSFTTSGAPRTYTLNSALTVSGGGLLIGNSNDIITLNVATDFNVGSGATVGTPVFDVAHVLAIGGSFINNGTVRFTNLASPVALSYYTTTSTTGYISTNFTGAANNVITCNGITDFQSINVQKGIDQTYTLTITASATSNFQLFGRNDQVDIGSVNSANVIVGKALAIQTGTVVLGVNIVIPSLTQGDNYRINGAACLIINGANVTTVIGTGSLGNRAMVPYGKLRIISGYFTAGNSAGIVIRGQGELVIEGGTVEASQFRPSVVATSNPRGSFDMSGGVFNVTGIGETTNQYTRFTLPYTNNIFKMSGGVVNVYEPNNSNPILNGGILINTLPSNIEVTGGTFNCYIANSTNALREFGINSNAPFYNLNIYKLSGGTRISQLCDLVVDPGGAPSTIPATGLTVLNDFTLGSNVTFNALGQNVTVGGNFTVDATASYITGANTTTFGGTSPSRVAQTVALNQASPTFNNLTVSNINSSGTVTFSGNNPLVNGNLFIQYGTLQDGGKTISVLGNLSNSATHTGAGKILANGTLAQTFGGSGAGVYTNLEVNKTTGSATLMANQTVNGTFTLTNGILNLANFNLLIGVNGSISLSSPSATKMIQTDGVPSNGGLSKIYNASTGTFLFPLGTSGKYRPATASISAGTYGILTMRPVPLRHPNATIPPATTNDVLTHYWRVSSVGFASVGAANLNFQYAAGDIPTGDPNDNTFVTGRFTQSNSLWYTANYIQQAANQIDFTFNQIDGEYTAGLLSAFGGVTVYESRKTGFWSVANTWKRTQGGVDIENPSTTIPSSTSPTIIRSSHTVGADVPAGNIEVSSIRIDASAFLDFGMTLDGQTHNFNVCLPGLGGNGTIRISSSLPTAKFPSGDFINFLNINGGGTVEYYIAASSFTLPVASQAPISSSMANYWNLNFVTTGGTIKFPNMNLNLANNLNITSYSGGVAVVDTLTNGNITIGNNLIVNSGTLQFGKGGTNRTVTVSGSVTNAGTISVASGGTRIHNLSIGANFTNTGTFNAQPGTFSESQIVTTFIGTANASLSGAGTTTKFGRLILNKGSNQTPVLDVTATNFSLAGNTFGTTKALTLTNGTFKLNNSQSIILSSGLDNTTNFQIPTTAHLWVAQGKAVINATGIFAGLQLDGKLSITSTGVVRLAGASNSTADNFIQYASTGNPTIDMSGDSLIVGSQLRGNAQAVSGGLIYTQSAGTVSIGGQSAPTPAKGVFEILNAGSSFTMSGGRIIVARTQGSASIADIILQPATSNVTGGTIQVGNSRTPNSARININGTASIWNLVVDNTTGGATKPNLNMYVNTLKVLRDLTLNTGTSLTTNSLDVFIGGNYTNDGTFTPGTNTTNFNGTAVNQTLSGTTAPTFYNLKVDNTATSGTVTLGGGNVLVNNDLTLTNGTFVGNSRVITVKRNISNSAVHSSTSGYILLDATTGQTLSGDGTGEYGSIRIDNALNILASAALKINGTLTFVNGLLDIQTQALTFGVSGTTSGTFNGTRMIRTFGSISDGGVTKEVNSGAFSFNLPLGTDGFYTPVTYNATTNTAAGTITVRPIGNVHPSVTNGGVAAIDYFWNVTSTGLAGLNLTMTYTYDQVTANGRGDENLYLGGRLTPTPDWQTFNGAVNASSNVITISNVAFVIGDYTAGESSEFYPITTFLSNGTGGGNWEMASSWALNMVPPNGASVEIVGSDLITVTTNSRVAIRTKINANARLAIGATFGHNFGTIQGTGTLVLSANIFPGGNYSTFTAAGNGTVEFQSTGYSLPGGRTIYNNLVINSSGTINMVDAPITLNGNFIVSSGIFNNTVNRKVIVKGSIINNATYIAGTGASNENLELLGNFTNNGTFTPGNTNVQLRGTTNQTLSGSSSTVFTRFETNKTSGSILVQQNIRINTQITLSRGRIVLGTNNLTLGESALVKPDFVTSNSYIQVNSTGFLVRLITSLPMPNSSNFTLLPVGDAVDYLPFNFRLKAGTLDPGAQVAINIKNMAHPLRRNPTRYLNKYWTLEPTGISGTIDYDVRYTYVQASDYVILPVPESRQALPYKFSNAEWTSGTFFDYPNKTFIWNNLTSFSDFTGGVGMDDEDPVPVTLVSFSGDKVKNGNQLNWTTASERNSAWFDVERSADGFIYEFLGRIRTKSSSSKSESLLEYQFLDKYPFGGNNFYRLKQVDLDGLFEQSKPIVISNDLLNSHNWEIYPNPVSRNQDLKIEVGNMPGQKTIGIVDLLGKVRYLQTVESMQSIISLPITDLSSGVYQLMIQNNGQNEVKTFVVR